MDDQCDIVVFGHADVRRERFPLEVGGRFVPIEVESALTHRHDVRVGNHLFEIRERSITEFFGGVGVDPNGGPYEIAVGQPYHPARRRDVYPDGHHALQTGPSSAVEDFLDGTIFRADLKMTMGVEPHGRWSDRFVFDTRP
jgi:hypothetical protein